MSYKNELLDLFLLDIIKKICLNLLNWNFYNLNGGTLKIFIDYQKRIKHEKMIRNHKDFFRFLRLLFFIYLFISFSPLRLLGDTLQSYKIKLKGAKDPSSITVYLESSEEFFAVDKNGFLYSPFDETEKKTEIKLTYTNYVFEVIIFGKSEKYPITINEESPTANETPIIIEIKKKTVNKTSFNKTRNLREIKVRSKKEKISSSREILSSDEARLIPGTGGDILKGVANFPGVIPASGFSSDLYVRGGDARDTLYSFDDILIGNPFHLAGLYSVFSPLIIDKLTFYPSSFPTKFGNSQGAILDIKSKKEIDQQKVVSAGLDINLIQASAYVFVPIKLPVGDGMNIKVSARRTYFEAYLEILNNIDNPALDALKAFDLIPFFYDYNVIYDWNIRDGHTVWLSFLGAQDKLAINTDRFPAEDENGVTNQINFAIDSDELWDSQGIGYIFESKEGNIRYDVTLSHYKIVDKFSLQGNLLSRSDREFLRLVANGTHPLSKWFTAGFGIEYYLQYAPVDSLILPDVFSGPPDRGDGMSDAERFQALNEALANAETVRENVFRNSFTGYFTAYFNWKWIDFTLGLRLGGQDLNQSLHWDPRGFLKFLLAEDSFIYLNAGKYSQLPYIENVGEQTGTKELKTQWALHYAIGSEFTFNNVKILKDFKFKVEAYYKDLRDQTIDNPTYDDLYQQNYQSNPRFLDDGLGRAYGAEVSIRKRLSYGLFGWISYTWGRSERQEFKNQNIETLTDLNNNGSDYKNEERVWRAFEEDIEHYGKFVLSWKPVKWFSTGLTLSLNTGRPYTPQIISESISTMSNVNSGMISQVTNLIVQDDPNRIKAERYPLNYNISLRVEFYIPIKSVEMSIYLDIQNLQGFWHENITSYNYNYNIVIATHPDYIENLTPGPYPESERTGAFNGIPVLPLLGITVKY